MLPVDCSRLLFEFAEQIYVQADEEPCSQQNEPVGLSTAAYRANSEAILVHIQNSQISMVVH